MDTRASLPAANCRKSDIRVCVAERGPLYAAAITVTIRRCGGLELIASTDDVHKTTSLVARERPDVVLLGALAEHTEERDILKTIERVRPFGRLVCLLTHLNGDLALEALAAGADGCVSRDADPHEICASLLSVGGSNIFLPAEIQRRLLEHFRRGRKTNSACLTRREQEILHLSAQGLNVADIANRLSLGIPTIKTHLHHVYNKLQVSGRAAAIAEARRVGLLR